MLSKSRNHLESWEDYNETPAGKALLKMPEIWEDGTYPQKPEAPAAVSPPEAHATPSVLLKPAAPAPFKEALDDPYKAGTTLSSGLGYGDSADVFDSSDSLAAITEAYKHQRVFSERMVEKMKDRPFDGTTHQPATATPPVSAQPEVMATPHKIADWTAEQTPYRSVGQLVQPASDIVRKEAAEPLARKVVRAVQHKQPTNPAEQDLINLGGTVTKTAGDTYTRDNLIKATEAIHQGETEANESVYNHPVNVNDVMAAVGNGDTYNHSQTMGNTNGTARQGIEKGLRGMRLSLQEVRLMGNKLIDPDGKYVDTKGLQQWINSERQYLKNTKLPELLDFTKLDWKRNPDKFIELGGRYFRESLLGSHLFGYAADAIKGPGGTGVSRFLAPLSV